MQLFSLISALLLRVALLQSGDVALDSFALLLELFHRALQAPTADTRTRHRDVRVWGVGAEAASSSLSESMRGEDYEWSELDKKKACSEQWARLTCHS